MTIAFGPERDVAITKLIVSDEFPLRLERPHVRELADSIAELGCLHPPLARMESDGSFTLGPGEDRVAAHVLLGRPLVTVRMVTCEDHELELLREAENRVRRKESPAELLAMVEQLTAERDRLADGLERVARADVSDPAEVVNLPGWADHVLGLREAVDDMPGTERMLAECLDRIVADEPTDPDGLIDEDPEPGRKGGRPKTRRMLAVERVAAETGRPVETVRKAVEREERRREKASIETWGRVQAPEWLEPVLALRRTISGVYDRMKAAAGTLTATKLDMADVRDDLRSTARAIRMKRPAAVCAWCKNVEWYVSECTACHGRGWISEEMLEQVPAALRDPRRVMAQGDEFELEYTPPVAGGVWHTLDPEGDPERPEPAPGTVRLDDPEELEKYRGRDAAPLEPASHHIGPPSWSEEETSFGDDVAGPDGNYDSGIDLDDGPSPEDMGL